MPVSFFSSNSSSPPDTNDRSTERRLLSCLTQTLLMPISIPYMVLRGSVMIVSLICQHLTQVLRNLQTVGEDRSSLSRRFTPNNN